MNIIHFRGILNVSSKYLKKYIIDNIYIYIYITYIKVLSHKLHLK